MYFMQCIVLGVRSNTLEKDKMPALISPGLYGTLIRETLPLTHKWVANGNEMYQVLNRILFSVASVLFVTQIEGFQVDVYLS